MKKNLMTKLSVAGLLAAGALSLGACGSSNSGSTSSAQSAAPVASTTSQYTGPENAYLQKVGQDPDFGSVPVSSVLQDGEAVCTDFNQGADLSQVEADALEAEDGGNNLYNLTTTDYGTIIGAATMTLCPEYEQMVIAENN